MISITDASKKDLFTEDQLPRGAVMLCGRDTAGTEWGIVVKQRELLLDNYDFLSGVLYALPFSK